MLPFFRPRNDKDIGEKLVGKRKKYRLPRNGSAVGLTGVLLAYYRREVLPDGLMPPAGGRVELFAVIRTQAGRFFCYYVVTYPETEDIAGRQEYAHVCPDFDAVRDFLAAMAYPNRTKFADAVLAAARKTLAALDPTRAAPVAPDASPDAPPDASPDAPPDASPDAPPDASPDAPAGTAPDAQADPTPAASADTRLGSAAEASSGTILPAPETDEETPRSAA